MGFDAPNCYTSLAATGQRRAFDIRVIPRQMSFLATGCTMLHR
jgi:hypothetical protein